MAETKEQQLARLRQELGIEVKSEDEVDPDSGLTMADRARLTATGLLFNWADEAIAGVKALSPNITYEEALADEREKLKSAQEKPGSLKYEIGGAFIPTAGALALAPFTGGTSAGATAPTWARLLGIGATQGLAIGTGASEEEGLARVKDAPVAVATGAVANPLFAKLAQGTQAALSPLIDYTKRQITGKVGKKVEDELIRIISDSGLSVDDVLERVSKGEVIPEMSEEAYRVVSGFVKTAGPGSAVIRDAIVGRKNKFVEDLYQSLQKDLAPETKADNIFATFANNADELKKAESAAYTRIFDESAGQTFKEIDDAVLFLANSSRNSRNLINKKLDENGLKPIFKMVGKGDKAKLELTRSLSLEEGEIVKRAFMDAKNTAQRAGSSDKANTMKGYETTIKNILDKISPDLQATRKNWAMIEDSVKQFEAGQKIFSTKTDPEQFSITFQKLVDAGNEDAIAALRAGAASALKRKAKGSQKIGTVNKLAAETETRDILEILYPGESLDDIVNKINLASGAARAEAGIFKGSPTAGREGSASRVGQVGQTVADITRVVNSGGMDIGATSNIVTRLFGGKKPPFTDDQFEQIAKLVVSEDPEVLRRALTDETQLDAALQVFRKAINALGASQPRVTALTNVTEPVGDIYDPVVSGALEGIVNTISPETRTKVLESQR
tara:strand:- start:638 stop:2659 length:2022 start_codon:yes stop_codon:yes gene_type:complete